jgi:hypothetical protein
MEKTTNILYNPVKPSSMTTLSCSTNYPGNETPSIYRVDTLGGLEHRPFGLGYWSSPVCSSVWLHFQFSAWLWQPRSGQYLRSICSTLQLLEASTSHSRLLVCQSLYKAIWLLHMFTLAVSWYINWSGILNTSPRQANIYSLCPVKFVLSQASLGSATCFFL